MFINYFEPRALNWELPMGPDNVDIILECGKLTETETVVRNVAPDDGATEAIG